MKKFSISIFLFSLLAFCTNAHATLPAQEPLTSQPHFLGEPVVVCNPSTPIEISRFNSRLCEEQIISCNIIVIAAYDYGPNTSIQQFTQNSFGIKTTRYFLFRAPVKYLPYLLSHKGQKVTPKEYFSRTTLSHRKV